MNSIAGISQRPSRGRSKLIPRCIPAMALLCCIPCLAATVYRTVDENGVVSFSDIKPRDDGVVETLQIDTQDPQLTADDKQRLEDMRETTDRMAADRREREEHRAELRQLQAQTQSLPENEQPDYTEYMGYSSRHSSYYGYPPLRPCQPGLPGPPVYYPCPEYPVVHPPLSPPKYGSKGPNSQLMRPLVSPRR